MEATMKLIQPELRLEFDSQYSYDCSIRQALRILYAIWKIRNAAKIKRVEIALFESSNVRQWITLYAG